MQILRRCLFAGLLLLAPGATALGARAAAPPPYLTAADVDLTMLLPLPPAPGSALQGAEVQAVLDVQAAASRDRIAQAVVDAKETVFVMFGDILGPRVTPESAPKTTAMFSRIGESEDATVDPAKPFFGRVRPFLADPRIKALVPPSSSGSWPSGHTTRVTMMAAVLANMLPEQRGPIWARAADYAQSRVIGGMHFPSDLQAGQRAGTAMAQALFAIAEFRADLDAAKTELKGVLAH